DPEPRDRLADPERLLHRRRPARRARPAHERLTPMALLEVEDLHTYFKTLGIVGESGCGKSVTALSIMGLVPPPGRVVSGRALFEGQDLLQRKSRELEDIRGR